MATAARVGLDRGKNFERQANQQLSGSGSTWDYMDGSAVVGTLSVHTITKAEQLGGVHLME